MQFDSFHPVCISLLNDRPSRLSNPFFYLTLRKSTTLNLKSGKNMDPKVSIIMGSTSDLPVMEKAAKVLNDFCIPFEINALSAHRTPAEVEAFT